MYAGTIKSSLTENHNLFYWLFKNEQKTNAPLVLWLNGGPGSSSMFGLFMENGPLRVEKNGTGSGDFKIGLPTDGQGSWLDEADLLFLDQPVNTGFSYGDTYATTMNQISQEMLNFLTSFIFTEYPEYASRDFVISGESYAGKYLPELATTIHQYNIDQKKAGKTQLINLKAALIGDPFVSPVRQRLATHLIAKEVGIIEPVHLRQIAALRRNCENVIATDWSKADDPCGATIDYIAALSGGAVNYDATIFNYDLDAAEEPYKLYLSPMNNSKSDELYKALHIDQSPKDPKFTQGNQKVYEAIYPEEYIDWTHFYDSMLTLDGGLDVLVYAGTYD